jgi:uncharacterized protein YjdB
VRKIWLALLVSIFMLALAGPVASAVDGPPLSTDGVAVSFSPVSSYMRYEFPLTVTEDGKVTFHFYGGTLSVLDAKGAVAIWNASDYADRWIYVCKGLYTARITSGYASASVGLSATVEKMSADTEPNDTSSAAQQVSLPGTLKGIIGAQSDKDCFKFTVGARTGMNFSIVSADQYFPVSFNLYNAGGQRVKDLTVTQKVALNAGDYYLAVNRLANAGDNSPYTTAYTISASAFRCVDSLTVSPAEAQLEIGQTLSLNLTALPANHEETITVTNGDPSVVTVTGAGLVKAVKPGTATIQFTAPSGASAQAVITVLKPVATSYKLPKTCKATRGFIYSMYGWLTLPSGTRAPSGLTWSSSKKSVATITKEGVLTCVNLGKTQITAVNGKGKKFKTTLTVISNQLKNDKPKGKKGYIISYPKRVYYLDSNLNIEVFLYNNTKYNLRTDIYDGYIFELYDLAKSTSAPVLRRYVDWDPGRMKKYSWKVFKITLDRSLYDNCDLGLGQLYPLIYTEDELYAVKGIRPGGPMMRKPVIDPRRADAPSDFT